jgi:phosphatidylserine/phosphatidylglycerophosphate/cardiolipin synthase-like enzyme
MAKTERSPFHTLQALIAGRDDLVSRIAAPLWSRVGRTLQLSELSWVRSLFGEEGPETLVQALSTFDALDQTGALRARGLSHFLSALLGDTDRALPYAQQLAELVWTLPNSHHAHTVRGRSYLESCTRLINEAKEALTLVSPFVDPPGIGMLSLPLLSALSRGVAARLFAHDALDLGTPTSRALEELRREAERIKTDLSVYSADVATGRDRILNPLFHAKLVICDDRALLLGSANLTSYALGSNFEAGVLLGEAAAKEALFIMEGILRANTVYLVFRTTLSNRETV